MSGAVVVNQLEGAPEFHRTILKDEPVGADAFSGGGHSRTANALVSLIESGNHGDFAVGLEGSWGAGKSTVVRLAEIELARPERKINYKIFTYDLWANQTGHFRRSFLESLVQWCDVNYPDKQKDVRKFADAIASKTKIVNTQKHKQFGWFGISVIVFLYLTPLIYAWLSPTALKTPAGAYSLSLGALLALVAIVTFLAIFAYAAVGQYRAKRRATEGAIEAISRTLSVFSKDAERTNESQSIRDEDPTQYEFQKIFRGLLGAVNSDVSKTVLVFDNIDRLPSDKIEESWADIRAVIYGGTTYVDDFSSVIAIVPYAPDFTLDAFFEKNDDQTTDGYSKSDLFRKSFGSVLTVHPPVLSDAKRFFAEKCHEALPGLISKEAVSRLYRIFDRLVQKADLTTTPRQVISFINDVSGRMEQWKGVIPIETVGVFVAHQRKLLANPAALRDRDAIDGRMVRHADQPNLFRDLAALAFNVDRELAFQVLSHDGVKRALLSDSTADLERFASAADINGFFEVLGEVVDENAAEWAESSLTDYCHVIKNFAALTVDTSEVRFARGTLLSQIGSISRPAPKEWLEYTDFWKAIQLVEGEQPSKALLLQLANQVTLSLPAPGSQSFEDGRNWIKGLGPLFDEIASHLGEEAARDSFGSVNLPADALAILGAAYDCDETKLHIRDFRKPRNTQEIGDGIAKYAEGGQQFDYIWPEVKHLVDGKLRTQIFSSVVKPLETQIYEADDEFLVSQIAKAKLLLDGTLLIDKIFIARLSELYLSGTLTFYAHRTQSGAEGPDNEGTALFVWLVMARYGTTLPEIPNLQGLSIFGNIATADEWLRDLFSGEVANAGLFAKIAELVIGTNRVTYVLSRAAKEDEAAIFLEVGRSVVTSGKLYLPSVKTMLPIYDGLQAQLSGDIAPLQKALAKTGGLYWNDASLANIPASIIDLADFSEPGEWDGLLGFLRKSLADLTSTEWSDALKSPGKIVRALSKINARDPLRLVAVNIFEPLMATALTMIATGKPSIDFGLLIKSLPPQSRKRFAGEFFDRHDRHTGGIEAALANLTEILLEIPLAKNPDRAVERYLIPLISMKTQPAIDFMRRRDADFRSALRKCSKENRALVEELFESDSEEAEKEPDELLAAMIDILK